MTSNKIQISAISGIRCLLFNYHLITINVLIYGLIASMEIIASGSDFDKSVPSSSSSSLSSSPLLLLLHRALPTNLISNSEMSVSASFMKGNHHIDIVNSFGTSLNASFDCSQNVHKNASKAAQVYGIMEQQNRISNVETNDKATLGMLNKAHDDVSSNSGMKNYTNKKFNIFDFAPKHVAQIQLPVLHSKWQKILSRPKRYLAFPEGSSLTVTVCFTVGIIGNPRYNYMSFGLNWGLAYDLPNTSWILQHLHGFDSQPYPVSVYQRRTRRALYKEVETFVENMGYNGRDCILRTLCESRQYFQRAKLSMIGEMLRVIFSLPKQRLFTREINENADIQHYDHAYRNTENIDCEQHYDCSFSLLELAFGKYSTPPANYYSQHTQG